MDMAEIEKKINMEISIPQDLMKEIQTILNNNMTKAEKLKKELELRQDQAKLRRMLKLLNEQIDKQINWQMAS